MKHLYAANKCVGMSKISGEGPIDEKEVHFYNYAFVFFFFYV
jgi:hypothetical protein